MVLNGVTVAGIVVLVGRDPNNLVDDCGAEGKAEAVDGTAPNVETIEKNNYNNDYHEISFFFF